MAQQIEKEKVWHRGPSFDQLIKWKRDMGVYIHPEALKKFLRKYGFRPDTRHEYAKNVKTVIDRHITEILKDTEYFVLQDRISDEEYNEIVGKNNTDNQHYHPKWMSNASMEALRADDTWYGDDNFVDEAIKKSIDETVKNKK